MWLIITRLIILTKNKFWNFYKNRGKLGVQTISDGKLSQDI
jgi:hypothetical protein